MIELLDVKKQWSRIKAGFSSGVQFKTPAGQPSHRFVDGIDPSVKATQQMPESSAKSVFGGKSFSSRKK